MKTHTKNKMIKMVPIAFFTCFFISQSTVANEQVKVTELAQACTTCHGENGVSKDKNNPNLAGQKQGYLAKEITAFRDGKRHNPQMLPYVDKLSDEDISMLAHYFSTRKNNTKGNDNYNKQGENVRARCVSCHGMKGITVTTLWPNLAGQKSIYLQNQLQHFKSGKRKSPIMEVIAQELTDKEIVDVAEYYSQQAAY